VARLLPLVCDVRSEEAVSAAVARAVESFGGIDICINNASAIVLTDTIDTKMRRYDLMQEVNTRGTYLVSKTCMPHLLKSAQDNRNPHVLNISPPLNFKEKWFAPHVAYSIAKYGMSLCVLGMAGEFRDRGVAVNALWPRTTIATAAIENIVGGAEMMKTSRHPSIMADAAHWVLTRNAKTCSGNFFIDDDALRSAGVLNLDQYAVDLSAELTPDFFL